MLKKEKRQYLALIIRKMPLEVVCFSAVYQIYIYIYTIFVFSFLVNWLYQIQKTVVHTNNIL